MINKLLIYLLVIISITITQSSCAQKQSKIFIVRHAEKVTTDPADKDPELSAEGKQRALDLAASFKDIRLDEIYATKYKRNRQTASPLAEQKKLAVKIYDSKMQQAFADSLLKLKGKNMLIVGHSNTVLELIEALGTARPLQQLSDDDYDYFFEVTINKGKAFVKTSQYGAPHHRERTHE